MKKFLRAKRTAVYENADQFFQRELSKDNEPDQELSCNHVGLAEAEKCLIEYKASNLPKPITKSMSGFYLPDGLNYQRRTLTQGYFKLIKNTHCSLLGSANLQQISSIGYMHNDLSLTKEQVFAFIDQEERRENIEWKVFLKANLEWGKKLDSFRMQKKAAALASWQKFGGGSFQEKHIQRLVALDSTTTKELLSKVIEADALPGEDLDKLKKYI